MEEAIGEQDEFAHEDGESEFFGLTASDEAKVESLEDGVVTGSDQSCHVEDGTNLRTPAGDMTLATELATIAIKGGQTSKGSGLGAG